MPKTLICTEDAQQDLDDAYQWYQEQNHGLGQEFIRCVDAKLSEISRHPLHHQVVYREKVHRALTSLFLSILSMKKKQLRSLQSSISEEVQNLGKQEPDESGNLTLSKRKTSSRQSSLTS